MSTQNGIERCHPAQPAQIQTTTVIQPFPYQPCVAALVESQDFSASEAATILDCAADLEDYEQFFKASRHLLKLRLVKTSLSPAAQTTELRSLFHIFDRLRQTDPAERRLFLAEKQKS